jgi:RsiW-degrading membrane proteinase PrsW (M82 family)
MKWVVMPRMQQGVSALIWGVGTVALSGVLQELFKFLPVFFRLRLTSLAVDHRTAMALGAAVGIGFGLLEAILLTGKALALGIVSPWAVFERAFAILFHGAVGSIVAWGIWRRSGLRYYLLAALLHSLGNYSVILFHQHLLSPVALELSVAAFDLLILACALVIMKRGVRDLAVKEMSLEEV